MSDEKPTERKIENRQKISRLNRLDRDWLLDHLAGTIAMTSALHTLERNREGLNILLETGADS